MAKKTGKSLPQTELRKKIEELYENAFVEEEVFIGDVIEERGYSRKEIDKELGHKAHRMFVDIVMRDIDRTVAFEYHGEQHYSLVGNMTKTTADLLLNQQLDQEKSWILNRLGIPIVAVPFDMYIDERIIEDLIEKAYQEMENGNVGMSGCLECGRMFPTSAMSFGVCEACMEKRHEAEAEEIKEKQDEYKQSIADKKKAARKEYAQQQKEIAKQKREEAKEKKKQEKAKQQNDNYHNKDKMFDSYDDYEYEEDNEYYDDYDEDDDNTWNGYNRSNGKYKEEHKKYMKQKRKEAYQKYKQSQQYKDKKEKAKQKRKEAYQKRKRYMEEMEDE